MNQAASDFFASLPSEKETEPEFKFMEEPEKEPEQESKETETEARAEEAPEEDIENKRPNRKERRVEKQTEFLQKAWEEEREARIRLEEQVKALANTKREIDPDIKKILAGGVELDEAAAIFETILSKNSQEAEARALARLQELQSQDQQEVQSLAEEINQHIESIEDRYGVDLTDDADTRSAFLDFAESLAPQDSDALPNMDMAWRLFQSTRKAPPAQTERKASISSRSMTRSIQSRPEAKNLEPMSFDKLERSNIWDKVKNGFRSN